MATIRTGLLREIVSMSFDTLRTSKMRSALTVLGVVIGITSIVGMTSLIRGFDQSLRDSIRELGPEHDLRAEVRRAQLRVGQELPRGGAAPEPHDARTRARSRATARRSALVDVWLGSDGQQPVAHLLRPREDEADRRSSARPRTSRPSTSSSSSSGRLFTAVGSRAPPPGRRARPEPVAVAVPEHRSDRQEGADRRQRVHRHRRLRQAAEPGGFGGADDFAVIPFTAHEKFYGKVAEGLGEDRRRAASTRRCSAPR